jgi:hypothetical protein
VDELPPIGDVIARMRLMEFDDRTRYLQTLIGKPTKHALLLHQRALLVTALSEAELWPQRKHRRV